MCRPVVSATPRGIAVVACSDDERARLGDCVRRSHGRPSRSMPLVMGSGRRCTCGISAAVLMLAVPILSGCFPLGGTNPKELRSAAAALVPPGSRVIEQSDEDCVEFEPSPSCRLIYFIGPRKPTATLAREVETAAERRGWSLQRKDVREGGTQLRFKRPGLKAYVALVGHAGTEACRHRPGKYCASLIDISVD
jgi:hypothetical protein